MVLLYGADLRRGKRASSPAPRGGGRVEMREAEPLLRAGRVMVDTGDLAGREADVIAGEPIVNRLVGRATQFLAPS
jgi:hypothetical protein